MSEMDFLQKFYASCSLDEQRIESLKNKVVLRKFLKGQLVFSGSSRNIFCVARGTIKSYVITDDGKEVFSDFFKKGEIFGCLFSLNVNEYARVASDQAEIYVIKSSDLLELCSQSFLQQYLSDLESRINRTEGYFLKLMSLGVKERLIFFLETLARKKGQTNSEQIIIECSLPPSEIADSICATRQSISWHLNELKRIGWIVPAKDAIRLSHISYERFTKLKSRLEFMT